jgi:multisite-specific tRNA:(cytosine-C5)-methyltransferase
MVRNPDGTATKNIYYTNALAKEILQENEGKGLKFVHAGVKMFVKQDAPALDICPWRIQTDGLRLLETWVGPDRIVKLQKKETLRRLLIEMFPKFHGDEYKQLGEVGEQILPMKMGCCVLVVEPSVDEEGLPERMVFPLWKSIQSLNLMLPKEERKALLLRLFNDNTELVNMSKGWVGKQGTDKDQQADGQPKDADVKDTAASEATLTAVKEGGSPEAVVVEAGVQVENHKPSDDDDEDGGVIIID